MLPDHLGTTKQEAATAMRRLEETTVAAMVGWAKAAAEVEKLTAERDEDRAALDRVRELREHYRSSDDVVDGDLRAAELDTALDGSGT